MGLKVKKLLKSLLRLFFTLYTIVIVVSVVGFCGCGLLYLIVTGIVESMARSLAPPTYPGSVLMSTYQNGGPHAQWRTETYRSSDSIDKVFTFMEQHMKDFRPVEANLGGGFTNGQCRHDAFARLVSWAATLEQSEHNVPCAGVTIKRGRDNPQLTVIEIRTHWPSD
jgi:hypothetical protein